MSYRSIASSSASNYNIGFEYLLISGSHGGNIPLAPATLVSGTTYNFVNNVTLTGLGSYLLQINFDLQGDATTAFKQIKVVVSSATGIVFDNDLLLNTTLPDTGLKSISYSNFITPTSQPRYQITFTPTFTGTAPSISSPYLRLVKIA